ncbi:myosin light chain kinase 2, skeletal/cardiac muscle-like isoform X1 [Hippocampus zosterae]|uniref:myosin light chain kinase 2, skeletal/cardiac muscle-like isoform X1 n=1 Tax=Hippocampus zosterae TaxID=109293 RepID=UPI00223D4DE6|nr:myosin light chain kinase 2, skeletal/cardiac muscle-like isoform X1 [Hippocampus zosterae]XP_051944405.1 myosin light chain kinase 2, skeletal/cardiac muscle-like isoform X1 [Hippocampus zosterae]XP_051944406.1 myosin light chain kinase 2, skeletal/cardiac muscle-like isoform X1 [Hippocampus zosterae]XP_051944407.1 myosin light chain kinase 2, skeletal/cardiac muscle-like isoform X1 [Hippocampus zosterae]
MTSFMKTTGPGKRVGESSSFDLIQNRIESLSGKMDKLINLQEKVLVRLDAKSSGIEKEEKEYVKSHVPHGEVYQSQGRDVKDIYQEMSSIMLAVNHRSEIQAQKMEGMEKLVLSMQQVISFIGETIKSSRVMELMFKGDTKGNKGKQVSKRKSSDTIKKSDKKTTSNKAKKGNEDITDVCEAATLLSSHRTKLHGPKRYLATRKYGTFFNDHNNDGAERPGLTPKAQKTMNPPDTAGISLKKQALLREEVQKLNRENAEKSTQQFSAVYLNLQADVPTGSDSRSYQEAGLGAGEDEENDPDEDVYATEEVVEVQEEVEVVQEEEEEKALKEYEVEEVVEEVIEEVEELTIEESQTSESDNPTDPSRDDCEATFLDTQMEVSVTATGSFVTEELVVVEEYTEVLEVEKDEDKEEQEDWAVFQADGVEFQFDLKERLAREKKEKAKPEEQKEPEDEVQYFIDSTPPPAAPFNHRIVSAKPNQISNFYTINWQEVLGGGRFGQVHKCVENSSGLTLAAKVIKAKSQKEKELVKNEIQVMNNLDHANLIQLYAAYESRNDIILVLEYVGGGELFDRIIDENYTLMELDAVVFIRQICEGLQHMHKMYIIHLDLKPENILCVSRVTNKIKIIDFGLARIYKPREKLRVNFGTPEFLAPEVINYDFVSFNTDMWSLGVITYMLLSGLCPFLGDDDNETLNNILACQCSFEEQEFVDTSEEAKDFISRLLVINKSWRMGASEALRHPWLSDAGLHHKLHTKKTMCRSRRSSCVPPTDS